MRIIHLAVPKVDQGISGGEVCMMELVKYFAAHHIHNTIVTSSVGKNVYEGSGILGSHTYIDYATFDLSENEARGHIFFSWVLCAIRAYRRMRNMSVHRGDIVMSHSAFFPDFITAQAVRNKKVRMFYWNHLIPPRIFYGYEGEFTGKARFPRANVVFFHINRALFRYILGYEDVIITVSNYYRKRLQHIYPKTCVYAVSHYGGTEETVDRTYKKIYDIAWLGRFHPQKGLDQFLDIICRLQKKQKQIKVVVIGGGNSRLEARFRKKLSDFKLTRVVDYKGTIVDRKRVDVLLRKSKVFAMTSTYESYGQVSLEAMKQGVPVVAYNLPPYEPLKAGMVTVPILDNDAFVHEVVRLLSNHAYYRAQSHRASAHAKQFSWKSVGQDVLDIITEKTT